MIKYIYIFPVCLVLLTALISYSIMSNSDLTFLTNNVREIQSSKKRISLIEYFKSKSNRNEVLFLQETHSSMKNGNAWVNDFNCPVFFSDGASSTCGVLTADLGKIIERKQIKQI